MQLLIYSVTFKVIIFTESHANKILKLVYYSFQVGLMVVGWVADFYHSLHWLYHSVDKILTLFLLLILVLYHFIVYLLHIHLMFSINIELAGCGLSFIIGLSLLLFSNLMITGMTFKIKAYRGLYGIAACT